MHQVGGFRFASGKGVKVLEMPYERSDLAMDFILPDDTAGLPKLEEGLDAARFREWTSSLNSEQVERQMRLVRLRLRLQGRQVLEQPLRRLRLGLRLQGRPLLERALQQRTLSRCTLIIDEHAEVERR